MKGLRLESSPESTAVPSPSRLLATLVLGGLLLAAQLAAAPFFAAPFFATPEPAASDAWATLTRLRSNLERMGPTTARFEQTFVPSGFSEGESEGGTLAIDLPRCLRWDYTGEFPKTFLLCENTVFYWSPGELRGEKYPLEHEESPGLDFFLLTPQQLRERYEATLSAAPSAGTGAKGETNELRLQLTPRAKVAQEGRSGAAAISHIEATLSAGAEFLLGLSYADLDGNLTTFRILDYKKGAAAALFEPPAELSWQEP